MALGHTMPGDFDLLWFGKVAHVAGERGCLIVMTSFDDFIHKDIVGLERSACDTDGEVGGLHDGACSYEQKGENECFFHNSEMSMRLHGESSRRMTRIPSASTYTVSLSVCWAY